MAKNSLFEAATSNWSQIPRRVWILGLLAGGFSSGIDLIFWLNRIDPDWRLLAASLVPIAFIWLGATYAGTAGVLGSQTSLAGWFRFSGASLLLVLPLSTALLAIFLMKSSLSEDGRLGILLIGIVVQFLVLAFLPAWPIGQSLSRGWISPARVFQATQGHRWALLGLMFATGGINNSKLIPPISTANNIGEAVLIAGGNALVSLVSFAFLASIAAAAWEFAVRNDPALAPDSI